jgi:ribosome-binding protein aMBF1 (putative translation factor)
MTNAHFIKCDLCGKEISPEESEVIEEGRGLLVCENCAYEHKKG